MSITTIQPNSAGDGAMMTPANQNPSSALVEIEQSRAIQEVQAMCIIAQRSPRDVNRCHTAVMNELQRYSLAKSALYAYPRGGQTVTGPSIRMAEMIARNFKNLKYGTKILNIENGVAECESYCWDLEANNHMSLPFKIKLVRDTRQGPKPLTDERDVGELINNYGSRRRRTCILAMVPADIIEDAIKTTHETIKKGEASMPLNQRVRNLLNALHKEFQVDHGMIEGYFDHSVDQINADEFVVLFGVYNALKDGAKRDDYFKPKKTDTAEILKTPPAAAEPEPKNAQDETEKTVLLKKIDELIASKKLAADVITEKAGMPKSMFKNADLMELTRIYKALCL